MTVVGGTNNRHGEAKIGIGLPLPILNGDSDVPEWSAFTPGAANFFYEGNRSDHRHLQMHPGVLGKITETLTTDGKPARDEHYRAATVTLQQAALEGAVTITGLVGRIATVTHALSGAALGPAGIAFGVFGAGVSLWDGTRHISAGLQATSPAVRKRALLGGAGRLMQGVGTACGLAGMGLPALGLVGAGLDVDRREAGLQHPDAPDHDVVLADHARHRRARPDPGHEFARVELQLAQPSGVDVSLVLEGPLSREELFRRGDLIAREHQ
jgi:hypothetical protein